jgi:hypothetical protein
VNVQFIEAIQEGQTRAQVTLVTIWNMMKNWSTLNSAQLLGLEIRTTAQAFPLMRAATSNID